MAGVKLNDIIDGMDFQFEMSTSYFNKKTAEIVTISSEEFMGIEEKMPIKEFPEWQHDNIRIAKEILETDNYISLPSKYDIHEYEIMERFCLSLDNARIRDIMHSSIKGKEAFHRFKDNAHKLNIADKWYRFRHDALKQIAAQWCQQHNIEFLDE